MNAVSETINKVKGKKVVMWEGDAAGLSFLTETRNEGIEVSYIVDSNKTKLGNKLLGKIIK